MKIIKIAVIAMMGMSFGVSAQDNKIESTGNVGIGTTTPKSKFQISASENDRILISNSEVNYNKNSPKLSFFGFTYGNQITGPSIQKIHTAGYGQGRLAFFQHGGTDYTSEEEVMSILPNGNVGIGTTDPKGMLHISSPITTKNSTQNYDANLIIEGESNSRTTNQGASIGFVIPANTDGTNSWQQGRILVTPDNGNNSNASGRMHLQTRYLDNEAWAWKWRNNIVLRSSGNVGIGTTKPTAKLAVNGKIHTKEVRVDLNLSDWADFVFYDDYNLPTLKEVENHIKEKGHLKDIPSAKEVEKNGIYLGEMDAKLLQKIEELTLYTIEQEKKIKKLEKQQKEIDELKALVQKLLKDKN